MTSSLAARWHGVKLRHVVTLVAGALFLLAMAMGNTVWEAWQQYRDVRLTRSTNQLADHIIKAAASQALERGLTASALSASAEASAAMRARIDQYRSAGEKEFVRALKIADQVIPDANSHGLAAATLARTRAAYAGAQAARARVDATLGSSGRTIVTQEWVDAMTDLIQSAARLRQVAFGNSHLSPEVAYANLTVKHSAWLAAENAGLERAHVATQINADTAALSAFGSRMESLRSVVEGALKEIVNLRDAPGIAPPVVSAIDTMKKTFLGEFQAVREKFYYEAQQFEPMGAGGKHYSSSAAQWFDASTKGIDSILAISDAASKVAEQRADDIAAGALARFAVFACLFAANVLISFLVAAQLLAKLRQVATLNSSMEALASGKGDLTQRLPVMGDDEIGTTSRTFNGFIGQLQEIIGGVQRDIEQVSVASATLAANAHNIERSSQDQSEAASSTAATVEQITVSIGRVAESSRETASVSREEDRLAEAGERSVREFSEEIRSIASSVSDSARQIEDLGEHSNKIGGIVNVIKEIADQTNLLALNAAIEAARAGEQGRGFAVVADEVRKLAERTASATREISSMIGSIQTGTREVVESMNTHRGKIQGGVERASSAASTLAEIRLGARKTMEQVDAIVLATQEQSGASKQIACNVEAIARMSETNVTTVGETARAAVDLERLSAAVKAVVGRFNV